MIEFAMIAPLLFLVIFGIIDLSVLMFGIGATRFSAGEAIRVVAAEGNSGSVDIDMLRAIQRGPLGGTSLIQVTQVDIYKLDASLNRLGPAEHYDGNLSGSEVGYPVTTTNGTLSAAVVAGATTIKVNMPTKPKPCDIVTIDPSGSIDKVQATAISGASSPFTLTVAPLTFAHAAGVVATSITGPQTADQTECITIGSDTDEPAGSYDPGSRNTVFGSSDYVEVDIQYHYDWKTGLIRSFQPGGVTGTTKYFLRLEPRSF